MLVGLGRLPWLGSGLLALVYRRDDASIWVVVLFEVVLGTSTSRHGDAKQPGLRAERGERRDIGAATGCLLFLRSMGGAFGGTLVGALLANGLRTQLAETRHHAAHIDFGEARHGGGGLEGHRA